MISVSRFQPLFTVVAIAALAFFYQWKLSPNTVKNSVLPASYANPGLSGKWKRLSYDAPAQEPDTTAVLLNWSRFPNVVHIVDTLCDDSLNSVLAEIVVWNNSPKRISKDDFSNTRCVRERLKIHNSPANLYFQARFLACAESSTRFCFIQDDDYLVLPEVISALHARVSLTNSSVHLLPSHEHFSSELRKITTPEGIHTSFAWLGHGALVPRSDVVQFLDLMHLLNATEEEMKMADNYYTILSNTFVETWFDQGIELGGGQAFTVGTAGEERNRRHITKALEMLQDAITSKDITLPYVQRSSVLPLDDTYRAACAGAACLLEVKIRAFPSNIPRDAATATEMLKLEQENAEHIVDIARTTYHEHPLSLAVDGKPNTAFRSFSTAKANDTITLESFNTRKEVVELVFLVDKDTEPILGNAFFEMKVDNSWISSKGHLSCIDVDSAPILTDEVERAHPAHEKLRECGVKMLPPGPDGSGVHAYRARLSINLPFNWCIYEVWLRTSL